MKTKILLPLLVVIVGVVAIAFWRFAAQKDFNDASVLREQLQGNMQQNEGKGRQVVEKLKRLIVLDTSLKPTVATIVDITKLQEKNAFYDKAQNGDYLIITSNRAILYREEGNIIIDVMPIFIDPKENKQK